MPITDWFATKHPMWVHLPIAAALLLPLPLLMAQRAGKGVRPWWIACRYLAWAGLLGMLPALLSGFMWARTQGMLPPGELLATRGLMRLHQSAALAAFGLALLTLWAVHRRRMDHQGMGGLALALGCAWAVAVGLAGHYGGSMVFGAEAPPPVAAASAPAADPEADAPYRFLDFGALLPQRDGYVRIPAHGDRWGRTYLTASALDAYKAGRPLPPGSYAVMATAQDRNGQPGADPGPLYGLEILADGKSQFTLYWASVPPAEQKSFGDSAYWRSPAPQLASCLQCHNGGASRPDQRASASAPAPQAAPAVQAPAPAQPAPAQPTAPAPRPRRVPKDVAPPE